MESAVTDRRYNSEFLPGFPQLPKLLGEVLLPLSI